RGGAWQHARSTTVRRDHQTHSSIKWAYKKQYIFLYRGVEHGNMRGVRQYDETTKRTAQKKWAYRKIVYSFISRGGAVWQLVGLITQRSQVQILPPQPNYFQNEQ